MATIDPSEIVTCDDLNKLLNTIDEKIRNINTIVSEYSSTIANLNEQNKFYSTKLNELNMINRGISSVDFGKNYLNEAGENYIYPGLFSRINSLGGITTKNNTSISIFDTLQNTNIVTAYPLQNKSGTIFDLKVKDRSLIIDYFTNDFADISLSFIISIPSFKANVVSIPIPEYLSMSMKINKITAKTSNVLLAEPETISDIYFVLDIPKEYISENTNINLNYKYRYRVTIPNIDVTNLTTDKNISIDFRVKKHENDYTLTQAIFNKGSGFTFDKYNVVTLSFAANEENLLSSNFIDSISVKNQSGLNKTINEFLGLGIGYYRLFIDGGNSPILLNNLELTYKVR